MRFKNKNNNCRYIRHFGAILVGLFTLFIIVTCSTNQVVTPDTASPVITVSGYTNGQSIDRITNDGFSIPAATANDDVDGMVAVMTNDDDYDNAVANTYTVVYSASDNAGNTSMFTLTINIIATDTTAPVITVSGYTNGQSIDRITNDGFSIPAATANDDVDGMVAVMTNDDDYDNAVANTYTVVYSASDNAGNTSMFTLTINIIATDTTAPVITVSGYTNNQLVLVEQSGGFVIPEATANDNVDGSVSVMTNDGGYDNGMAGTYTVVYSASDNTGNTSTFTLTLEVADRTAPVITVSGYTNNQLVLVEQGGGFVIPESTANDIADGSVSVMTNDGGYDNGMAGTYTVVYSASDNVGSTTTFTLIINVRNEAPVITVSGYTNGQSIDRITTDGFSIPAATANDDVAGSVAVMTNDGGFDNTMAGTYTVTYSASDNVGNTSMFTLTINIIATDTTAPVITIAGGQYTNGETIRSRVGSGFAVPTATATDNIDGSVDVRIILDRVGSIYNNNEAGAYSVFYAAQDRASNYSEVGIILQVFGSSPLFSILGGYEDSDEVLVEQGGGFTIPAASTATDFDGSTVAVVTNDGGYDNNVPGIYEVVYSAQGSSGRAFRRLYLNVADRTLPVISLPGYRDLQEVHVSIGDGFVLPLPTDATATDNIDGSIPVTISDGGYDDDVIGVYDVLYTATDSAGNRAQIRLEINVYNAINESFNSTDATNRWTYFDEDHTDNVRSGSFTVSNGLAELVSGANASDLVGIERNGLNFVLNGVQDLDNFILTVTVDSVSATSSSNNPHSIGIRSVSSVEKNNKIGANMGVNIYEENGVMKMNIVADFVNHFSRTISNFSIEDYKDGFVLEMHYENGNPHVTTLSPDLTVYIDSVNVYGERINFESGEGNTFPDITYRPTFDDDSYVKLNHGGGGISVKYDSVVLQ